MVAQLNGAGKKIQVVDVLIKEHFMLDRLLDERFGVLGDQSKPNTIEELVEAPWYTEANLDRAFEFYIDKRPVIDQVLKKYFKDGAPAKRRELDIRVRACSIPLQSGVRILEREKTLPCSLLVSLFTLPFDSFDELLEKQTKKD